MTKNTVILTEFVRQAIRRTVVKPYLNHNQELPAFLTDATLERLIEGAVEHGEGGSHLNLAPPRVRDIVDKFSKGAAEPSAVILTSSGCRYFLRQLLEPVMPGSVVLSHNEIPTGVRVVSLGVLGQ